MTYWLNMVVEHGPNAGRCGWWNDADRKRLFSGDELALAARGEPNETYICRCGQCRLVELAR